MFVESFTSHELFFKCLILQICLALHFFGNNCASLCCTSNDIEEKIRDLSSTDIQEFKNLPSIAHYFKGKKELNANQFKVLAKN